MSKNCTPVVSTFLLFKADTKAEYEGLTFHGNGTDMSQMCIMHACSASQGGSQARQLTAQEVLSPHWPPSALSAGASFQRAAPEAPLSPAQGLMHLAHMVNKQDRPCETALNGWQQASVHILVAERKM